MARRPSGLLELPAYEGAVRIARFYLDRAGQAAGRLKKKGDEQALHRLVTAYLRLAIAMAAKYRSSASVAWFDRTSALS